MKYLKIKCNRIIPLKGFSAIYLFGTIYQRIEHCSKIIDARTMNHEGIHSCQAEDFSSNRILGHVPFYLIYLTEWLIKLILKVFYWKIKPYESISFEQEAYLYESDFDYQKTRKKWSWIKYIFKLCK